jgi:hypothetical protein
MLGASYISQYYASDREFGSIYLDSAVIDEVKDASVVLILLHSFKIRNNKKVDLSY